MRRYKIWDKQEPVYLLGHDEQGRKVNTPEQWIERYPWADIPGAKCIIHGGVINGQICEEFTSFTQLRKEQGCPIVFDGTMTDDEILTTIEIFEDTPPEVEEGVDPLERVAAALEYQNLSNMDDGEAV
jgi:hypothetical protein